MDTEYQQHLMEIVYQVEILVVLDGMVKVVVLISLKLYDRIRTRWLYDILCEAMMYQI